MAIDHFVPEGKVLYVPTGGFKFVGPVHVSLGGRVKLPATYTDGTSTKNIPPKIVEKPLPVLELVDIDPDDEEPFWDDQPSV
jgi:hypothetical protein